MKKGFLLRLLGIDTRTLGKLILFDGFNTIFTGTTLEPAWKDNQKNVSCVPAGKYTVYPRVSEKFGQHFEVKGIVDRSLILIHAGNRPEDTQGCILIGSMFTDIDGDKKMDVGLSKNALRSLRDKAPEGFTLEITSVP